MRKLGFDSALKFSGFAFIYAFFLIVFLLNFVVFPLPFEPAIVPAFVVMAIFYWAIYRPSIVPPVFCFLLGIGADLIANFPLGLHALSFTLLQWFISSQRRYLMGQPYILTWLALGLSVFVIELVRWIVLESSDGFGAIFDNFLDFIISFLLFPIVNLALVRVHKILPAGQREYT